MTEQNNEKKLRMLVILTFEPKKGKKALTDAQVDDIEADFLEELSAFCKQIDKSYKVETGYEVSEADMSLETFALWRHNIDRDEEGTDHVLGIFCLALGWLCGQGVDPEIAVETAQKWSDVLEDSKCVHCEREARAAKVG